jgi:catechol-2,3-dioxygenase
VNEKIPLKGVVLDAPDPRELADFYCRLLGWEINSSDDTWVTTVSPPVGARPMEWQPQPDVRVYADPVGHVFCFFT